MNDRQKIALGLAGLILVGSALSFGPSAISVTQKIQNLQSAFEARDFQLQADLLTDLAEENPWWKVLWESSGETYFQLGAYDQAIDSYENARDKNSLSETGWIRLGEAYQMTGNFKAAESAWGMVQQDPDALMRLAGLYQDQGELNAAINAWNQYLSLTEDPEEGVYYQIGLLLAVESPADAVFYLEQGGTRYPAGPRIARAIRNTLAEERAYQLMVSGQALAAEKHWELAVQAFKKAAALRPDYAEAYLYWGEALQHLGEQDSDPLELLERGIALDNQSPLANMFLGLYWGRLGSHRQALDYFTLAEQVWPDQPDLLVEQGRSLGALGELESALTKYQNALEAAPEDPLYYRQLAEFCLLYSYQVRDLGLPAARMAVQLDDQAPANLDLMGQVLLDLDDQMNAVQFFQRALDVDPAYAPAHFHLGIYYSTREETDLAVYYLQQVMIHAHNPALKDQAARLLASY
jgi:tetratricopeptide (TPR) repeat protein